MNYMTVLLLISLSIGLAYAFPNLVSSPGFQYQPQQPIDTNGQHAYQAPSSSDERGPCPGLNALANHGYVNRNGISTPQQIFDVSTILGFGAGLSALLTALAIIAGNGVVFSIGNGSLLTGIGLNTHGYLEGDTSYKSCDCYLCPTATGCDNFDFYDSVWSTTYNAAQPYGNLYGIQTFITAAKSRYDQCRTSNPNCVFGPIQAVFHYLTPCLFAYIFPNGTDGEPTETIENTWIGIIKNASGQRSGISGGGRIPNNWYPRQTPLTLLDGAQCFNQIYTPNPVLLGATVNGQFVPDKLQIPSQPSSNDIICFIYNAVLRMATTNNLSAINAILNPFFVTDLLNCTAY